MAERAKKFTAHQRHVGACAPNVAFRIGHHWQGAQICSFGELVQIIRDPRLPEHRQHLGEPSFIFDGATFARSRSFRACTFAIEDLAFDVRAKRFGSRQFL